MADLSFLTDVKVSGKLNAGDLWTKVKEQMTHETQQSFVLNANEIAEEINKLQSSELTDLKKEIGQLIINVDRYLVHYQTAMNKEKYLIQANTLASQEVRSFIEGKGIHTQNVKLGTGDKNKSLADTATKLYIQMINVFQKLKLFDPNASIVVYTQTGNRQEFNFDANSISGSWKSQRDKMYVSCTVTGKDILAEAQRLSRNTEKVYNGIITVRQQIRNDYNNFVDLAHTYIFDMEKMSGSDMQKARGGAIAEAFEIHYQNNINSFWKSIDGMGHPVIAGEKDKAHYGGWVAIYYMLHEASGTTPGYIRPDVQWAQVKKYNAELVKITNLESMLKILINILDANTTKKVNAIIAQFNRPDSYGNFNALVQGFQPEFEAIVNEELLDLRLT